MLIAKLYRLARNVHFVSGLIEAGRDFVAVDVTQANKVMVRCTRHVGMEARSDQRAKAARRR